VTGTATDDEKVATVTVNGVPAVLEPTNNPNDPREIAFASSLPLSDGANQIAVVATDISGKSAADTRTVYLDSQDPSVTWSPAEGTVYPTPGSVTISGTAADNLGISSITLNGALVYTNAGTPQTSASFSRTLTLAGGTHQLTLVVKDLGNRTVTETRTITVNAPKSETTLTTTPSPSVFGQAVTVTATVRPEGTSAGTPTGPVTFSVDGNQVATIFLNATGTASLTLPNLAVGVRSIAAAYNGSFIYLASSATASHTVDKVSTTTTLASSLNPSTFGQSVTFTATVVSVAPGTGTPAGSVQFRRNGVDEGPAIGLVNGTASKTLSALDAGTPPIEAVYLGNATYATSTGSVTQTIRQATPNVTWNTPAEIVYGTALGAAQLNAAASVPGAFVYSPDAGVVLTAGQHTLTVTFTPTDANYESRTTTTTVNVAKAKPTVGTSGGAFIYDGSPHPSVGTANVPGTFSYAYVPGGAAAPVNASPAPYHVTATFTPDDVANYESASASNTITISKAPARILLTGLAQIYSGAPRAVIATTEPAGLTGLSVTYDGSATAPVDAGSYAVRATLDNGNYAAPDAIATLVIGKANGAVAIAGPASIVYAQTGVVTATAAGDGALSYAVVTPTICSINPATGVVTMNTGTGTCRVRATLSEGRNYFGATSNELSIAAQKATGSISVKITSPSSGTATLAGMSFMISASFTNVAAFEKHSCVVNWGNGSTTVGTITESGGSGKCTALYRYPAKGTYLVAVTISDTNRTGTSPAITVNVR
jgi:hypothetical protein